MRYTREQLALNIGAGISEPLLGINPLTGKAERVLIDYGGLYDADAQPQGFYFASDTNIPSTASLGFAGGYWGGNESAFDNFVERAVLGGLGAIAGVGAFSAFGATTAAVESSAAVTSAEASAATISTETAMYGEVAASGIDFGAQGIGWTATETGGVPTLAEQTGSAVAASGADFGATGTGFTLTESTGVTPLVAEQTGAIATASSALSATASTVSTALSAGKKILSVVQQMSGSKRAIQPAYLPQQNRSNGFVGTLYNRDAGEAPDGAGAGQFNPAWLIAGVLAVVFLFFGTFLLRSR